MLFGLGTATNVNAVLVLGMALVQQAFDVNEDLLQDVAVRLTPIFCTHGLFLTGFGQLVRRPAV